MYKVRIVAFSLFIRMIDEFHNLVWIMFERGVLNG